MNAAQNVNQNAARRRRTLLLGATAIFLLAFTPQISAGESSKKASQKNKATKKKKGVTSSKKTLSTKTLLNTANGAESGAALDAKHGGAQRCEACHTEDGWVPARFAHERTGFALTGAHENKACFSCHGGNFSRSLTVSCAGCHKDPHGQMLGNRCVECHRTASWRTEMDASAHFTTNFPLFGRHGALPCEECHLNRRDRGFRQPAVACVECHLNQYQQAAMVNFDHERSRVSVDCKKCHQPVSFTPAFFAPHDGCFPISGGNHRGVTCQQCHNSLSGLVADGTCQTRNQTCKECHQHRCEVMDGEHGGVEGYECESLKCASCHAR